MRNPRLLFSLIAVVAALAIASSCKFSSPASYVREAGGSGQVVDTTYYPYDDNDAKNMGPGHFSCSQYNSEQNWYIAPSDTFGDDKLWSGPPCPVNPNGGNPACSLIQTTCGVKVKVTCAKNCKSDAQQVVVMITDVCPKNHPLNIQHNACQGGPHFDLAKSAWALMHDANDNISVRYEVVDGSTPLGPVNGSSSTPSSPSSPPAPQNPTAQNPSSQQNPGSYQVPIYNTPSSQQPSYISPGASTASGNPGSSPSGGSSGQWCDSYQTNSCFPYCTNGSNTGNSFGWQPELHGPNGGSCRVP